MTRIYSGGNSFFYIDGIPKQRGAYEIIRTGNLIGIRMGRRDGWLKGCELQPFSVYGNINGVPAANPEQLLTYLSGFIFIGQTATIMTIWGSITGQLTDQGDLAIALDNKVDVITSWKQISDISELPAPVSGVIELNTAGILYEFFGVIDLQGNTLRISETVSLRGGSQEIAGVSNGNVEIVSTCTIAYFRFENVAMTINAPTGAFDWTFVNFVNCPNVLNVAAADNIIFQTFGFINSPNFRITGTINSLVVSPNSIFRSVTNPNAVLFDITPTAIINRRIRIQDSVFETNAPTQTAVRVQSGASIGIESFIFKTVRMNGNGTAFSGINGDDDRAFFFEVVGGNSINSTAIANMYMKNNTTPTVVSVSGTRYAMAGMTEFGAVRQRFIHDVATNSLIYTSIVPRIFNIQVAYSIISGNNNVVGVYIGIDRNGIPLNPDTDKITESEMYTTTSGTRPESSFSQCVVTLNQGDRVYVILQNISAATNITVEFMNMIIQKASV